MLWQMEEDLNILAIKRRPQYFGKMEANLNNINTTTICLKLEHNHNILSLAQLSPSFFYITNRTGTLVTQ
jgi:hypothetical protein